MMIFHIRPIAKQRLIEKAGAITSEELQQALDTLKDLTTL
jgi:mRNA interferase MazF